MQRAVAVAAIAIILTFWIFVNAAVD